jgi:hypothetical protein
VLVLDPDPDPPDELDEPPLQEDNTNPTAVRSTAHNCQGARLTVGSPIRFPLRPAETIVGYSGCQQLTISARNSIFRSVSTPQRSWMR